MCCLGVNPGALTVELVAVRGGAREARVMPHQGPAILTYESDGYAVSPSFLRQVDVHIQQVLEPAAKTRGQRGPVQPDRLQQELDAAVLGRLAEGLLSGYQRELPSHRQLQIRGVIRRQTLQWTL
jgi:hypothetical protein